MAVININTAIHSDIKTVFLLSCSIDLHQISVAHTQEKVLAGVDTGIVQLGDTITWEARHLCKTRTHTSYIDAFEPYVFFRDTMLEGAFKYFSHEHFFEATDHGGCMMRDKLTVEAPYGWLGKGFMRLYLKGYLKNFLQKRNAVIKEFAESDKWKLILPHATI